MVIEITGCTLFESESHGGFKETRGGCSPTLRANKVCVGAIMEEIYDKALNKTAKDSKIRIRKLTPRECWRLMAFDDADFDKAQEVNSNTQLYKQAGNSIVVSVLEAIFKEMM